MPSIRSYRAALLLSALLTLAVAGCGHLTDSCGRERRNVTASTSESTSGLSDYATVMLTQDRGMPAHSFGISRDRSFLSERWIHTPTRNMSWPLGSSTAGRHGVATGPARSSRRGNRRDWRRPVCLCRPHLIRPTLRPGPDRPSRARHHHRLRARNGCFGLWKRCSSETGGGCHVTDVPSRRGARR